MISEQYMKRSIIFTGNRTIEDWQGLFPDLIITNSVMDRIAIKRLMLTNKVKLRIINLRN
ncbi:ATP-binding protein [candidate division WOR-3 bacterium]|nr:ATP-binding protein [candidate division WOR-3 bacterium]MCK4528449.1 ATP-binding protein [candidate division WOR-3 bacterium]